MMYFNRNGDLVVTVDTVEHWLHEVAKQADTPDGFLALDGAENRWNADINAMMEMAIERNDR